MIENCGIYCIENLINGKKYIGLSRRLDKRYSEHMRKLKKNSHKNEHFQSAWNKYGEINFKYTIIECCEENLLNLRECFYILEYKSNDREFGYNLMDGGKSNGHHSDETKTRISTKLLNHPVSEETRKILSEKNKGRSATPETKLKMSISQKKAIKNYKIKPPKEPKEKLPRPNIGKPLNKMKKAKNSRSIYFGVVFENDRNKWGAKVFFPNKKMKRIGRYELEIDAAKAYNDYVIKNELKKPLNIFSEGD